MIRCSLEHLSYAMNSVGTTCRVSRLGRVSIAQVTFRLASADGFHAAALKSIKEQKLVGSHPSQAGRVPPD